MLFNLSENKNTIQVAVTGDCNCMHLVHKTFIY